MQHTYGSLHTAVLSWFEENGRSLPWRATDDPYRVLVAEVMLQQTQVARVVPAYLGFLARFPTVQALAGAAVAEVIRAWGGLGYNRRALNLYRAARQVVDRHGGAVPADPAELRALPGVGAYTAAAVACFAFGAHVPVVDTNVRRVLGRVLAGGRAPPAYAEVFFPAMAETALPPGDAWRWNQALMDIGATHCSARNPACHACPLRTHCRAAPMYLETPRQVAEARRGYGTRQPPFVGSRRYYRGRVIAHLRSLVAEQDCDLETLCRVVGAEDDAGRPEWMLGLLRGLEEEGLVDLTPGSVGGVRVSLPRG